MAVVMTPKAILCAFALRAMPPSERTHALCALRVFQSLPPLADVGLTLVQDTRATLIARLSLSQMVTAAVMPNCYRTT